MAVSRSRSRSRSCSPSSTPAFDGYAHPAACRLPTSTGSPSDPGDPRRDPDPGRPLRGSSNCERKNDETSIHCRRRSRDDRRSRHQHGDTATAYPGQAAGQDNSADANALAGNANLTGQNIDQSQSGSGTQVAGQDNSSGQAAEAGAIALQDKPSNTAVGIRVLSPGDDGNVRPVQQRRRERAGRQPQPHRPEHRPVPGRDGRACDRTGGHTVRLPVGHPGRGPVEQQLAGRRRPRRRGAGQAEQHGCRDPGAEPGR